MRRELTRGRALTISAFLLLILGLAGWGLKGVASRQWAWQDTMLLKAEFPTISGVEKGARVRVQGMDAGVVDSIGIPDAPGRPVVLNLRIDRRLMHLIRSDARATIATQGVVGARFIEILPGRADAPSLASGSAIEVAMPVEFNDLVREASTSLRRLDATVAAAEKGLNEFNAIATSIREGKGSLGKFIQDDEAHRKLVALTQTGEKTLHDLDENLSALKRTWPISRYFDDRAFYDKEKVLFHPGADRVARSFAAEDLFEPGRSVLTQAGQVQLDNLAGWFKATLKPATECVVAAYRENDQDAELSQALTQEQAETVRRYLSAKHKIQSIGWFKSRKVAAVGFGNYVPRSLEPNAVEPPRSNRVEILLFTPRG